MKKLNIFILAITTLILTACSQLSNTSDRNIINQAGELCKFTLELNSSTKSRTLYAIDIEDYVEYNITELRFTKDNQTVEPIVEKVNEFTSWFLPAGTYNINLKATATFYDGQDITAVLNVYGEKSFTLELGEVNIIQIPLEFEHLSTDTGDITLDISFRREFYCNYIPANFMSIGERNEDESIITVGSSDSAFCVTLKSLSTNEIIPLDFNEIWERIEDSVDKEIPYNLKLVVSNTDPIPAGFYELKIITTMYDEYTGKLYTNHFVLKDSLVEILNGITNHQSIDLPLYNPIVEEETITLDSTSTRFITYTGVLNSEEYTVRVYSDVYNSMGEDFNINSGRQFDNSTDFCFDTVTGNFLFTQKQGQTETIKYIDNQNSNPKDVTLAYNGTSLSNYNNITASDNNLFVRSGEFIYKTNLTENEHGETEYSTELLNENIDGELTEDDKLSVICRSAYDMAAYGDNLFICYFNNAEDCYELINATDIDNSEPVFIYSVTDDFKHLKDMMFVDNILYLLFTQFESDPEFDDYIQEDGTVNQVLNSSMSHPKIKNRSRLSAFRYNPINSTFENIGSYENVGESAYYSHDHSTSKDQLGLLGPVKFCGIQKTDDTTYIYIADEGVACIGDFNGPYLPEEISRVVAIEHTTSNFYGYLNINQCFTLGEDQYFESIFNPETYIIQSVRNY